MFEALECTECRTAYRASLFLQLGARMLDLRETI